MLDPHWVFAGAALGLVGSTRYSVAIVHGRARPNLITWSMWALAPLIGFLAQLDAGVGLPALMTLSASAGPLIVIVTSVVARRSYAMLGAFDIACGLISVAALTAWLGMKHTSLTVLFAVAADAVAALPTVLKSWRHPDSENALFYGLVAVGAAITLLTVSDWALATWTFAAYQLVICLTLVAVVTARRHAPTHAA